jgi:hypothetical protein
MNGTVLQTALAPGRTAMIDEDEKASYSEGSGQPASGERFYPWLIAAALAIFIFLLFYSQKIHGSM